MTNGNTCCSPFTGGSAWRATAMRSVGDFQLFDDGVVLGTVHEVVDRHVLSAWGHVPRALSEVLVGHDQVDVVGQVGDGQVDHRDVVETGLLHLVTQDGG